MTTMPHFARPTKTDRALVAVANALRATHGAIIGDLVHAGYGLRDALRLCLADDDDRIDAFGVEADRADDASTYFRAMDALREAHGQGPGSARWDVAGMILDAMMEGAQ